MCLSTPSFVTTHQRAGPIRSQKPTTSVLHRRKENDVQRVRKLKITVRRSCRIVHRNCWSRPRSEVPYGCLTISSLEGSQIYSKAPGRAIEFKLQSRYTGMRHFKAGTAQLPCGVMRGQLAGVSTNVGCDEHRLGVVTSVLLIITIFISVSIFINTSTDIDPSTFERSPSN